MKKYKLQWLLIIIMMTAVGCTLKHPAGMIMTVNGPIQPGEMGMTLPHEHVLVDFVGAEDTGYHRWDRDQVAQQVLPYLMQMRELGLQTLVECTPKYMGRDPELMRMLSKASGLQILTNTGYYGAYGYKYLPPHVLTDTAEELAARWIDEWEHGIENTGIRPGFIKIAVDGDTSLSEMHCKLVRAAAIAHNATGLVINCHSGPGTPFRQVYNLVLKEGAPADALIWTHANRGTVQENMDLAQQGVWISYDKLNDNPETIQHYVDLLGNMKKNRLLQKGLVSHDAGWYDPAKPNGGPFRDYTTAFSKLVPALLENGFTRADIDQIFIENPKQAYTIKSISGKD